MLDSANYTPRLRTQFRETIRAALKEEFGYSNDMQIPRLDKIVLNIGCGAEAVKDSKKAKSAQEDLTLIAGQKALVTNAKNSIAGFRVREGMPLGPWDAARCSWEECELPALVADASLAFRRPGPTTIRPERG